MWVETLLVLLLLVVPPAVSLPTFTLSTEEEAIMVAWSAEPASTLHNFTVSVPGSAVKTGNQSDLQSPSRVIITGLKPGVKYEVIITGYSFSGGLLQVLNKEVVTKPLPPVIEVINPDRVTTDSIMIMWKGTTSSSQSNYKIEYRDTSTTNSTEFSDTVQGSQTRYYLTGLKPGHNYTIRVYAISFNEYSRPAVTYENTEPLPANITSLTATGTHTMYITWAAAPDSIQSGFRITYEKPGSNRPMNVTGCVSNACTLNIDNTFTSGQQVIVRVYAIQGKRESNPAILIGNTKPQPVSALRLNEATRQVNSLMILWQEPPVYTTFSVRVDPQEGLGSTPSKSDQDWTYTQNGLRSGQRYTFTVHTISGKAQSEPMTLSAYTRPPMPLPVTYESGSISTLNVIWEEPILAGTFARYRLTISGISDPDNSIEMERTAPRRATFENLEPGSQHTVTIVTVVDVDVYSEPAMVDMYVKPLKPERILLSSRSKDQLTVVWNEPPNTRSNSFSGFTISIRNLPGSKKDYAHPSTKEATFSNLSPGTQYTIDVRTVSGDRLSDPTSASFYTRPNAPKALQTVSVTNSSIAVDWTKPDPVGSLPGYDAYQVNITAPGGQPVTQSLTEETRNYNFTGLQSGTEYSIRLSSVIRGTLSDTVSITVFTSPSPPSSFRVISKTTNQLDLAWRAPMLGVVESYVLTITPFLRTPFEVPTSNTFDSNTFNASLNFLKAGRSYDLQLHSTKNSKASEPIKLMATMQPHSPRDLYIAYNATNSVEVRWQAPRDSPFNGFFLKVRNSEDMEISRTEVLGDAKSFNIEGLSPGQRYTLTLYTLSNGVLSEGVDKQFATSPEGVATIEPIFIATDAIEIRWSEPSGTRFKGYDLSVSPNDGGLSLPVKISRNATLQYRYENLRPGVLYNISIQVVASLGSTSKPFSREISTKPSQVINLEATPTGTSSIRLQWAVNPMSVQTMFKVRYGTDQGSLLVLNIQHEDGKTAYSTNLVNLAAGRAYSITVQAMGNSQSEASLVKQTTNPEPVEELETMVESPKSLVINWETAQDSRQTAYLVRYQGTHIAGEGTWRQVEVRENRASLEDLHPGELYQIEVTALSDNVPSLSVTVTANTPPLPPMELAVDHSQLTTTSVRITWVASEGSYSTGWFYRYSLQGRSVWLQEESIPYRSVTETALTRLEAGQKYTVEVYSVTDDGLRSQQPAIITITIKPELTTVLVKDNSTTTNSTLVVRYSVNTGEFDHYVFTINSTVHEPVQKGREDTSREVRFSGLTAGQLYTIAVRTVSGDESSQQGTWYFATRPNKPILNATRHEQDIWLHIVRPQGQVSQYMVDCQVQEANVTPCKPSRQTVEATDSPVTLMYSQLVPHTPYRFTVKSVIRTGEQSKEIILPVQTVEAPPGAVGAFRYSDLKPFGMRLEWNRPEKANGEIKQYIIRYHGTKKNRPAHVSGDIELADSVTSYEVNNLKAGYDYNISIVAVTVGEGSQTTFAVSTPILPPSMKALPTERLRPQALNQTVSYNEFAVRIVDPFTERHGEVVNYTIIITTDKDDPQLLNTNLPAWADVEGRQIDGTYQAIKKCPDLFSPVSQCEGPSVVMRRRKKRAAGGDDEIEFIVGFNKDCKSAAITDYCNGVVRPEKEYFVILRGYTEGGFTNSPPSEPVVTIPAPAGADGVTILITVLVVVLLLLLIVAGLILFVLRRRGYICNNDDIDGSSHSGDKHILRPRNIGSPKSFGSHSPFRETSRPISVAHFGEHFKAMSADSDFKFSEEYEDLKPVGRDQSTIAAELPCNRNKNRFTNILPYDHSRVKLLPTDDEEGTDYINANYMPGFNSKREFIVTQGPLPSTRDDFWRMVWEQNCRAIVMLTRCVEKGREKCDHYWPVDSEPMFYGDLQVLILNETDSHEWVLTEFKISKGEQSRTIKHFHYRAWPDFGVPQQPQTLIRFVRLVRSKMPPDGGPIVVHCSAGVGRSGTFIALDHLLQRIREYDEVDIFGLVFEMRRHRVWMVQTEQQYICIHQSLQCVLEGKENESSPYSGEDNEGFDDDEGITMDTN